MLAQNRHHHIFTMKDPNPTRGECEALRLLKRILDIHTAQASSAYVSGEMTRCLLSADALMRSLRLPMGAKQSGRPLTVTKPATLRRIASLHAQGMNFSQIADATGISRGNVRHHLKPSAAMLNACGI
jgi:DNA-binding transcriptional ArsR family regulator